MRRGVEAGRFLYRRLDTLLFWTGQNKTGGCTRTGGSPRLLFHRVGVRSRPSRPLRSRVKFSLLFHLSRASPRPPPLVTPVLIRIGAASLVLTGFRVGGGKFSGTVLDTGECENESVRWAGGRMDGRSKFAAASLKARAARLIGSSHAIIVLSSPTVF